MTASLHNLPVSLALLDDKDAHGTAVQDRLGTTDHRMTRFASAADFLTALGDGQRFDLLLLASQDETTHRSLRAACEVLGVALLVIPQGGPGNGLPSQSETPAWRKRAEDPPVWDGSSREMVRGAYRLVDASRTVFLRGRPIRLAPQLFAFAWALFRNSDIVLTREWLWSSIWNAPPGRAEGRVIDVCAANLRKKLALGSDNGFVLRAIYRKGYQLVTVAPGHLHDHGSSEPDTR